MYRSVANGEQPARPSTGERRTAKRAVQIALINGLGALIGFLLHVGLARLLGTSEYGSYVFIVTLATVLGVVALLGFDTASLRFIAEYREKREFRMLAAFRRFTQSRVLAAAAVLGGIWVAFSVGALNDVPLQKPLHLCGAALLLCIAYAQLHGSLLQGAGRAAESQAIQLLVRPVLILGAIAAVWLASGTVSATNALVVTAAATALAGVWMHAKGLNHADGEASAHPSGVSPTAWGSAAKSMLGLAVANQVLVGGDIVIAAIVLGPADTGVYAAAAKLAALVSFATISFNFVLAPTISALYARRDMAALQNEVSHLTVGATLFALLVLAAMAAVGREIISLFGEDFERGYIALLVLCVGQTVLSANGAVGFLMTMTNNHQTAFRVVASSAALLALLSFALAPLLGILGIAIAAALATAFRSIALHYYVRKRLGMKTVPLAALPKFAHTAFVRAKEYGKAHFPRSYAFLHRIYYPVLREARLISKVGVRGLVRHTLASREWLESLPIQQARFVTISNGNLNDLDALITYLNTLGAPYSAGGHSLYLPPALIARSAFKEVVAHLPNNCGVKILRNVYTGNAVQYLHGPGHSPIQRAITYTPVQMVLVANLLNSEGLGPRVLDCIRMRSGDTEWFAYVVEHCEGEEPSATICKAGIDRLKALERQRVFTVTAPGGYDHPDFSCPDCNGNAITRKSDGAFQYLDFQNFVLEDYGRYLAALAKGATNASHFGDRSIFRGGGYLYQSVPGVSLSSKRATDFRGSLIAEMLASARLSVAGKLVLDVGCNLGMMMGDYLAKGAFWCHGWDRERVVSHTQRLLMAVGCTRFSVTGANLTPSRDLAQDLPDHLRPLVAGCVISYLSIKGHIGWMDSLVTLPWQTLIVEAHEDESEEKLSAEIHDLSVRANADVVARNLVKDGDSGSRHLMVLVRRNT
jgi:O-antigen/teichoic acid export membrane protein